MDISTPSAKVVMETTCRHGKLEDTDNIVKLSARVQQVFTDSESAQQIGPLERNNVTEAICRRHCLVLEEIASASSLTSRLLGCAFFRPLHVDHFVSTTDFQISSFPPPWFFMHSVMLAPESQGHGLGKILVLRAFQHLQEEVHRGTVLLDCWAGAVKLRTFYEQLGFTFAAVVPQEDYEIAIYFKSLSLFNESKAKLE